MINMETGDETLNIEIQEGKETLKANENVISNEITFKIKTNFICFTLLPLLIFQRHYLAFFYPVTRRIIKVPCVQ